LGINDRGDIVGFTSIPAAQVPEPSTWAMMLLGFAGLGFAFRQVAAQGVATGTSFRFNARS
jgi:hypothetical protein